MAEASVDALRRVLLFSSLSDKDLERVMEISKEVTHKDGHMVVEEDHSAIGFHLILSGTAETSQHGTVLGTMGPGDYFGEISLIDGKPRSATVTARGELRTLAIPAWNFNQLLDEHPQLTRAMMVALADRIRRFPLTH
jgi:CRP/FNR family cyclic AMP-dependent transcriptional regulator